MALFSLMHRLAWHSASINVYTEIIEVYHFGIYTKLMDIVYDPVKNAANVIKHGMPLADAVHFEWDEALVWDDARKNYSEARMCALGYIGNRIHYIVYVVRNDVVRIISLRKANSREVKRYAKA